MSERLLDDLIEVCRRHDATFWEGVLAAAGLASVGFEAQIVGLSSREQARIERQVDLAACAAVTAAHGVTCDPKLVVRALAEVIARLSEMAKERT